MTAQVHQPRRAIPPTTGQPHHNATVLVLIKIPSTPAAHHESRKMPGLPASVDLDECISRLYKKELLAESVIEAICAKTKELLMRESNVVHVRAPVTVVGDIHGQFFDLIEIFKIGGWCPDTNYLFLGALRLFSSPHGRAS